MRIGEALLGSLAPPPYRLGIVLGYAFAFVVAQCQNVLRLGVSLLGSLAIPLYRLGIVFGYAFAIVVAIA